jgi:catechol 2,3-dioxygenase-like lactoylglutathione lyase family enzyme
MALIGFAHYNIRASRDLLERLRAFYCDVVGLRVGSRPEFSNFGYWLYAGTQDLLHLTEAGEGDVRSVDARPTFDHVAFNCAGRIEYERRLADHGISHEVATVPGTGQVQFFLKDPGGNGVELNFAANDA